MPLRLCAFAFFAIKKKTPSILEKMSEHLKAENIIAEKVIGAAIEVHREVGGPGLTEPFYEACLSEELRLRNIAHVLQRTIAVTYKGMRIREPLRIDMLVGEKVIVENKAVGKANPLFRAQLLTYLRLTGLKLGLLLDFGYATMRDGITRVVNDL